MPLGIQFIRDKPTGCSLNKTRLPQCRNRRETTFQGLWIVCLPARKRLEDSDSLFCANIQESLTLMCFRYHSPSSNTQACGLVPSVVGEKFTFTQLPLKSVGNSRRFVLRPDSFFVFVGFALCEAMSYFLPVRRILNFISTTPKHFRYIFAIYSNIREFGLNVKRKRAIAGYLCSHSSHRAPCAREMG